MTCFHSTSSYLVCFDLFCDSFSCFVFVCLLSVNLWAHRRPSMDFPSLTLHRQLLFFWHVPHDIVLTDQRSWWEDREMHYGDWIGSCVLPYLFCFWFLGGGVKVIFNIALINPILRFVCFVLFWFGTNHLLICLTVRPILWRTYWVVHVSLANVQKYLRSEPNSLAHTLVMILMHTCVWFYYISLHGYG